MLGRFVLEIGELFRFFGIDGTNYNTEERIGRTLKIKTPSGEYKQINFLIKKKGDVYDFCFEDGLSIRCDENHLVKTNSGYSKIQEVSYVETVDGSKEFVSKEFVGCKDVYDMGLDFPHEYITDKGIICHNTTTAKILADKTDSEMHYINISDKRGVDTLDTEIKGFASSYSMDGRKKVIICDEFDFSTPVLQASLRAPLEAFSENCVFLFTANYESKIMDAIKSRTVRIEMKPMSTDFIQKRCEYILTQEGISFDPKDVESLVKQYGTDIRKTINELQKYSIGGILTIEAASGSQESNLKIIDALANRDVVSIRKIIASNTVDYTFLYRLLYEKLLDILDKQGDKETAGIVLLALGEYMYRDSNVSDREINFACCCQEIIKALN